MRKSTVIILHFVFWIVIPGIMMLIWFYVSRLGPQLVDPLAIQEYESQLLKGLTLTPLYTVIPFYVGFFTQKWFVKNPSRYFAIAVFVMVLFLVEYFSRLQILSDNHFLSAVSLTTVYYLLIFALGQTLKATIMGIEKRKFKSDLEREEIKTQLELIKSQINPHFLFNTLNNIDILITDDPEKASQYLKQLSDILRYNLYETKSEIIPLIKEVENIKKFLDLQKIRTLNQKFVNFTVDGEIEGNNIAPMVFLPFIENAFKYATNKKIENAVMIQIIVDHQTLVFECNNHIGNQNDIDSNASGLGLKLVMKRLDLIYKNNYTLEHNSETNWYRVKLKINLCGHYLHNN